VVHYPYLIVGGGMAADAAVRGIRAVDPHRSIGIISAEFDPPYKRPPLSKKLWAGKPLASVWLNASTQGADIHLGRSVRALNLCCKQVIDARGTSYGFDKLLLATGVRPRRLSVGGDRVISFRTLDDYRRLRGLADHGDRLAVVGGGFIGSEIAAALATNGKQVIHLFPGDAIGDRLFPRDLARFVTDAYREQGVEVLPRHTVVDLEERTGGVILRARNAHNGQVRELAVDGVVAGIGTEPNVELAAAAGLQVDGGIVVDEVLRTSHPDVYAAGDVASFYAPALGARRRVEHEDNAKTMGRLAGQAMAGEPTPYHHLPFFYSDLFDLGYEAVGDVNPRLETVADWVEPYREGVIYYLRGERVRGVLLWNVWDQVEAARQLISNPSPFRPLDLAGRLPMAS
jgi:NADPH-dependent 2,4-dienoyl-CoA reductase/sulfur reductase-like enzyme